MATQLAHKNENAVEEQQQEDRYSHVKPNGPTCQTRLVYAWEDKVFPETQGGGYLTLDECREFVRFVWRDLDLSRPPRILDGRGTKCALSGSGAISLPRWARNYTVLTHELAHCVTEFIDEEDNYDHGGVFLHVYFTLMTRYCKQKYGVLYRSALDAGLRVHRLKLKVHLQYA